MRVGALLGTVLVAGLLLLQDRQSLERGNRLYRAGDPLAATEVYEELLPRADFNLGTALLGLDADSAEVFLRRATEADDPAAAQRGYYNLGYRLLALSQAPMGPDSALLILAEAVESNRSALRLDPTDENARWNLALAQRRLDALVPPGEQAGRESGGDTDDELASNDQQLARSEDAEADSGLEPEDPRDADNTGQRQGPREGAREAWAAQDPGPMSPADAVGLLATVVDDPEALIRGILWSRRPDVAWWANQPYPGGPW